MIKILKNMFVTIMAILVTFVAPASTYALTEAQLDFYAQNNILFYDPSATDCETTPNGIFKGEQYTLTDEEIRGLARVAYKENSCNFTAFKTELSIMANLYDKNGSKFSNIVDYVLNSGWFGRGPDSGTWKAYYNSEASLSDEYVKAAEDILVKGNHTLPKEILEHDCIGDLEWIELDGVKHYATNPGLCRGSGLEDKSLYVPNKTKIKNVYGSEYVFYQWAGGKESSCGDPFGYFEGNAPSESYSTTTGNNRNYAGATVWSEPELQTIEANRPFYEKAAAKHGFPWQILAVLHSHEHSLQRSNPQHFQTDAWAAKDPENILSEGPFGLHSWALSGRVRYLRKDSLTDAEFQQAVDDAAQFIVESYPDIDLNDSDGIKKLFFRYNGTAQVYIDKAIAMGFSEEQARNGEGSAYVMNRYDAQRDPTSSSMSPLWPGRFISDGKYDSTKTSDGFGAFVQYEALAGNSYCSSAGGIITKTAILLSWEGHGHAITDPKPEYVTAMKEVGSWILPCGRSGECPYYGASCDQFVATVIRYSGADPDFPIFHGSYSNGDGSGQNHYMDDHPEMYQRIENLGNSSNLQPGDIFVVNNDATFDYHILLYIGEIDGQDSQASASWGGRTGEHFAGVPYSDYNLEYAIYRRINF